jgi:hypothetical protein
MTARKLLLLMYRIKNVAPPDSAFMITELAEDIMITESGDQMVTE